MTAITLRRHDSRGRPLLAVLGIGVALVASLASFGGRGHQIDGARQICQERRLDSCKLLGAGDVAGQMKNECRLDAIHDVRHCRRISNVGVYPACP